MKPAKLWAARYGFEGGHLVIKDDRHWVFLWRGQLIGVECQDFGWSVESNGLRRNFEDLYEALDWLDGRLRRGFRF